MEDELEGLDLEGSEEAEGKKGLWKATLAILVTALILLIALGFIRYWMVHSYGGW